MEPRGRGAGLQRLPGRLAVRPAPPPGAAASPPGAVPRDLRLRDAPLGRPRDGLRGRQPRHPGGRPLHRHRGARPVQPRLPAGLPAARLVPVAGADQRAVHQPQPHPAGHRAPAQGVPERAGARGCPAVSALRRHGGGGAAARAGGARLPVDPGRRAGPVVRAGRGLRGGVEVLPVGGGGPSRPEPVDGGPRHLPAGAGLLPGARAPVPVAGRVGVRGGRGRRGDAAAPRLPRAHAPVGGAGGQPGGAVLRARRVRQRRGRGDHRGGAAGAGRQPAEPAGAGGRDRRRGAGAGALRALLADPRHPARAADAPDGRRRARHRWRDALAARAAPAWPARSGRGPGAATMIGMLLQAVFVERVPSLYLKDTRIELSDLLFVLVVAAGLARLLRVRRYTPLLRWLLLLGIVLLVSLLRGMLTISPQGSINDFRQYLQFAGPALYFATFPPSAWLSDRIGRIWLAAAGVMVALVTLRWLDVFAGVHLGVPAEEFGNDTAIRVIDGPYTFFLATAAVLTLPAWVQHGRRARRLRWLSMLLLLFVMLLDRRTVWLAMLVGVVVLLLRNRRFGRRALAMLAGAAIVTSLVFVAFPGSGSDQEPLARSATSTGTLTWRVDGWSELLSSWSENPANWLVGRPFGSGFERRVEGSQVDSHPHNFYIETMLRSGVAGLLALIALTAGLLRALWRLGRGSGARGLFGPDVLPALVAMQLVWFITWVPGSEQGIVTGLALALVATRARAPSRDPGRARQRDDQATVAAPGVAGEIAGAPGPGRGAPSPRPGPHAGPAAGACAALRRGPGRARRRPAAGRGRAPRGDQLLPRRRCPPSGPRVAKGRPAVRRRRTRHRSERREGATRRRCPPARPRPLALGRPDPAERAAR